jgi:hypothetical protein
LLVTGVPQKDCILGAGYWIDGDLKRVNPDRMHRALGCLAFGAAHEEPATPNGHELQHY